MNKKFTFMVAALLAATSAFAQLSTDRKVELKDFVSGRAYYLAATHATDGSALQAFTAASFYQEGDIKPESVKEDAQWFVEKNAQGQYSFKNLEGLYLAFKLENGSYVAETNKDEAKKETALRWFKYAADGKLQLMNVEGEALYLGLKSSASTYVPAVLKSTDYVQKNNFSLFEAYNTQVSVQDLKKDEGTNFSLSFGETSLQGDSTFVDLTVVTLKNDIAANVSDKTSAFSLSGEEFLLMVSGKATDGEIANADDFKAAKFVYLTKNKVDNNQITDAVSGYRYDVISGAELIKTANKIDLDNAKFTAYTSANQEGYIFKQSNVLDSEEVIWVDKVDAANQVSYVASRLEDCHKSPVEIVAGKGTRVAASTVANKQMLVVNVTATKKDDAKVYALGLNDYDSDVNLYEKKSEASLNYPKGQWLVTAGGDENTITLVNIQNPEQKVENIALYEAAGKGTYTIKNVSDFSGCETITLTEVADYNKENGYLNLEEVVGQKYTLRTQDVFSYVGTDVVDAYLKLEDNTFKTTPFAEQAAEWNISKVLESGKTNADTTKVTLDTYKYYAADGTQKEVKKEVLRYAFKYTLETEGKYIANSYKPNDTSLSFFIREVSKDRFVIAYSDQDVLSINNNTTVGVNNAVSAKAFAIEPVVAAPSFEATSKHVTFSTFAGGSMTNLNNAAVLTKETEELTADNFKFYVDSVNADYVTPNFFISLNGKYLVDGNQVVADATTACELDKITVDERDAIIESAEYLEAKRLMFVDAKRVEGQDKLVVDGDTIDTPSTYKFQILSDDNGNYALRTANGYVQNVNGQLVLTNSDENAELFTIEDTTAPTSNEGVVASEVKVIANNGSIVVKNAAGKNVVVSTILGQVVANEVLTSDNATINVPAGIVVVAVEGESFKVNVK